MEELKDKNTVEEVNDNDVELVESEEVVEIALAENEVEEDAVNTSNSDNENQFEYTEGEISGLTPQQKKRKEIFDKITTGILIALLASPVAIVLYIFLWFILR